jgi:hypothetical protein
MEVLVKANLGSGVLACVLAGHGQFRFEAYDHAGALFKDLDHPTLSAALDHLHRFTVTEFAGSTYVTTDAAYFKEFE